MADTPAAAQAPPAQPGAAAPPEPPKLLSQEEVNSILAREKRDYESKMSEYKKKATEWDKQQEATKTEIQRERDARTAAEKERDTLKLERDQEKWRAKFGKKNNIPEADWDRLRGSTEADIETDAKAWAKSRGLDKAGGPTPSGGEKPGEHQRFNDFVLASTGRGGR